MVTSACQQTPQMRLSRVLEALGVTRSVWYAHRKSELRRPGRKPRAVPETLAEKVRAVAHEYPWWGYKRIAAGGAAGRAVVRGATSRPPANVPADDPLVRRSESLPSAASIGASFARPGAGSREAMTRSSHVSAPGPLTS